MRCWQSVRHGAVAGGKSTDHMDTPSDRMTNQADVRSASMPAFCLAEPEVLARHRWSKPELLGEAARGAWTDGVLSGFGTPQGFDMSRQRILLPSAGDRP